MTADRQEQGSGQHTMPIFATQNGNAKSADMGTVIQKVSKIVCHAHLTHDQFAYVTKCVRRTLALSPNRKPKRLPVLLTDPELEAFFKAIDGTGNIVHQLMLRLLFYSGVRVKELVGIRMADVFLAESKVFVNQGKGSKDRYVLVPDKLRLALTAYMQGRADQVYLFESNRRKPYTTRRVEQLVAAYQLQAGITKHVHPHLLRHQLLSWLTARGLTDAQIQLISGHRSKKSLEVYQHLSLENVSADYQKAMRGVEV